MSPFSHQSSSQRTPSQRSIEDMIADVEPRALTLKRDVVIASDDDAVDAPSVIVVVRDERRAQSRWASFVFGALGALFGLLSVVVALLTLRPTPQASPDIRAFVRPQTVDVVVPASHDASPADRENAQPREAPAPPPAQPAPPREAPAPPPAQPAQPREAPAPPPAQPAQPREAPAPPPAQPAPPREAPAPPPPAATQPGMFSPIGENRGDVAVPQTVNEASNETPRPTPVSAPPISYSFGDGSTGPDVGIRSTGVYNDTLKLDRSGP